MQHAAASTRTLMKMAEGAEKKNRGQGAFGLYQQVLQINPHHGEALFRLAKILHCSGEYAAATTLYERAIQENPKHLESYRMLCAVYESQNLAQQAIQMAQRAVRALPNEPLAYLTVALMLKRFGHLHLLPDYLQHACTQFPQHVELQHFYCVALKACNRFDEADGAYRELLAQHRVPAHLRIRFETDLPRFYHSNAQMDAVRAAFAASVERFTHEKARIDIAALTNEPLFALAFHHRDNKELLTAYNRMLRSVAPELNYTAPHCKAGYARKPGALRIGFLSRYMHDHSVGNCFRGVMLHLAKQPDLSVTLFNLANVMDRGIQEIMDAHVPIVSLPKVLGAAQQAVALHQLDILIYPDIGMDAMTHYLAMARLAPHQLCLGGHPETTGIDTMDYMLASRTYEPPYAQANYTERLLCLDGVTTLLSRPKNPQRRHTRQELGLPEDKTLYLCPMAIQKFHPDYDAILADILQRDDNAIILLFKDFQEATATEAFEKRLLQHCDPARVLFLPWLPLEAFQSTLKLADAVLDTIYFGGGNTVIHAFHLGVPMVTMPCQYARGRVVYSYYQWMDIAGAPIAKTLEEYAALAVKLANDRDYYNDLSQRIQERSTRLFEMQSHAPAFVQLMHDMVNRNLDAYSR